MRTIAKSESRSRHLDKRKAPENRGLFTGCSWLYPDLAGNPERWHELVAELHPFDVHKLNIVLQRLFVKTIFFINSSTLGATAYFYILDSEKYVFAMVYKLETIHQI